MPEPQQHGIRAASATHTTAHGDTGSLTRWAMPGIEPATSWFVVGFINHCATKGTPEGFLNIELPYDPAIPFVDAYPEKIVIGEDTCSPIFILHYLQ